LADNELLTVLEKRERKRILSELQASAEKEGHVPSTPFLLLRKMAYPLQCIAGVLLGIFIGVFALLANFLVIVWLLHLQF